jgi:hypothetical protein
MQYKHISALTASMAKISLWESESLTSIPGGDFDLFTHRFNLCWGDSSWCLFAVSPWESEKETQRQRGNRVKEISPHMTKRRRQKHTNTTRHNQQNKKKKVGVQI